MSWVRWESSSEPGEACQERHAHVGVFGEPEVSGERPPGERTARRAARAVKGSSGWYAATFPSRVATVVAAKDGGVVGERS